MAKSAISLFLVFFCDFWAIWGADGKPPKTPKTAVFRQKKTNQMPKRLEKD